METVPASGGGDEFTWIPPGVFEGYRLVRPLGAGGMGRVYLCHDLLLDRPVAIKFIARPDPDGRRRERFLLEGRALARLLHPNVVLTFRVGDVEGRPFLVSEFVAGQSLDQLQRPVRWRQLLEIGIGLSRGLAAVHAEGILHRDIKPQNVMLTPEGDVKLIDFGLATFIDQAGPQPSPGTGSPSGTSAVEETESDIDGDIPSPLRADHRLSRAGAVVGTRRYMSPERLEGRPATRQSDVFSLGCLLNELSRNAPDIDQRFRRIIDRCLEDDLRRRWASAAEVLREMEGLALETEVVGEVPPGNPYRGLQSFDSVHRACFIGRSREVATLVERLGTDPVVVVAGDSGVGKSSLCKAGVIPRIEESLVPGRPVRVLRLTPGRRPFANLARALAELLSVGEDLLQDRLRSEPTEVLRSLGRAIGGEMVVIFVDQGEELCTLADPEQAAWFSTALAALALSGGLLRVLVTVRGDFLTRLAALPGLGAEVARAPYLLQPLTPDRLREVILVPARRSGVSFASPEMVTELVRFATSSEGALPLLQFTLAELWEARDHHTNIIGVDALSSLGGVNGTFERHADRVLTALSPDLFAAARRLLPRLVTAQGTRASLTSEELRQRTPEERVALEALIAGRLIVVRGSAEMTIYEIAHEALIARWSTLRRWLDEDAAERHARERLGVAAREWERLGRRRDGLWTGRQLAGVESVETNSLGVRELSFLSASRLARRRTRLLRALMPLAALTVMGVAVVVGRFRARAELDRTLSQSLGSARELEREAQAHDVKAAKLRVEAMRLFDRDVGLGPEPPGEDSQKDAERTWSRILEDEAVAERVYGRATAALESAMFLDTTRSVVRQELARLIELRLMLAERMNHRELEADMSDRLKALRLPKGNGLTDQDDALLVVARTTGSDEATLAIAPYIADASGRLTLASARPLPVDQQHLPPGSYLVTASYPHCPPVRIPVLLGRGQRQVIQLPSPEACVVPPDFILVPASDSLTGSAEETLRAILENAPLHPIHLASFLVSRFEVTIGEYVQWLETLSPSERSRRAPNSNNEPSAVNLRRQGPYRWTISLKPSTTSYVVEWGKPLHYRERPRNAVQDWRRFPVTGISFKDATAYAAWLDRTGQVKGAHLCSDLEWEKAARGADGRVFTTGRTLLPEEANFDQTYGGGTGALGPDEVGRHPASASPYGAEDVHGNAYELVTTSRWGQTAAIVGGAWDREANSQQLNDRYRQNPDWRDAHFGFRVCAAVREQ